MTRGNQRDANRERAEKRKDKAEGGKKREGPRIAGVNPDAEALQKKVAEKQRLIAEGLLEEKKKPEHKEKSMVNPHTGKRDPDWTKKETERMKKLAGN